VNGSLLTGEAIATDGSVLDRFSIELDRRGRKTQP